MQQKKFKFELGESVKISVSGESGEVVGRAEYATAGNSYYIHYKAADGRAVTCWRDEEYLELA